MQQAEIGIIGLAVMGENLALNIASKNFCVAVYNRTLLEVDDFVNGRGKGHEILGCRSVEELCSRLKRPRKAMLMVKAGEPVDELIDQLLPFLEDGDIIIDGGNSNFQDTIRRCQRVESEGKLYVGAGVSGGEEGALLGPSIMPGGSPTAWEHIKPIFQAISARTPEGEMCCEWIGDNGAGHFAKMVHNGIEYSDMQMIAEAYHLMKQGLGLNNEEMSRVFAEWNNGELNSYLIEITRDLFMVQEDGRYVLDLILDSAGQKGTGKWTGVAALELGQPMTTVVEAVFARSLSAMKDERETASKAFPQRPVEFTKDRSALIEDLREALYASKITSYAQGFMLLRAAAKEYGWRLNLGAIALVWRGGCIIRSAFLGRIKEAYDRDAALSNLFLDAFFSDAILKAEGAWRRTLMEAIALEIPTPAMSSALAFFDGYRSGWLPANLLQAQRDYFGAHTYERVDKPRGEFFHTNWTGRGGDTPATTYTA